MPGICQFGIFQAGGAPPDFAKSNMPGIFFLILCTRMAKMPVHKICQAYATLAYWPFLASSICKCGICLAYFPLTSLRCALRTKYAWHMPGIFVTGEHIPLTEYSNTVHDPAVRCCDMGGWHEATWTIGGRWVGQQLPLLQQHTKGEWPQHWHGWCSLLQVQFVQQSGGPGSIQDETKWL